MCFPDGGGSIAQLHSIIATVAVVSFWKPSSPEKDRFVTRCSLLLIPLPFLVLRPCGRERFEKGNSRQLLPRILKVGSQLTV